MPAPPARARAKVSRRAASGLAEVTPPPRSNGRPRVFSDSQLGAIATQLRKPTRPWVSDKTEYDTRAGANWRAEALGLGLADAGTDIELERRTWKTSQDRFCWAVRRREKS